MTYVIVGSCIKDDACIEVCPVDCIYDVDRMVVIHPGECIDCGACEPACPVEAIVEADVLAGDDMRFAEVNAAITDGAAAVEASLGEAVGSPNAHSDRVEVGADGE